MAILYWALFGLIAGSIANFISPSPRGGFFASIVLGIIGAVIGGFLGQTFLGVGVSGFNLMSFFLAVVGALIVLFIGRMLMRNNSN